MKTEIIEFHETEIYCPVEEGKIYVAIKPICEALDIDSDAQNRRIKRDEILSQLRSQVTAVGRDEKARKMVCLPLEFIFGWIFTIDTSQVKTKAKESLINYKKEVYHLLYDHFWNNAKSIKRKENMLSESERRIAEMEAKKKQLGKDIKSEKERFKKIALAPATQMDLFLENGEAQ